MNFKDFIINENKVFTGVSPESVIWWSNYSRSRIFKSEQEARDWILRQRERADVDPSNIFGVDGFEYNKAFSEAIPLWKSGHVWKIGKRIAKDNRLRLNQLEVKNPDFRYLHQIAQANGTEEYELHPIKWIRILVEPNDYYLSQPKELQRIKNLAYQIKENKWIEAVVYNYTDQSIIEGQHRIRAMKMLGFNTVPGVGIEYQET